MVLKYNFKCSLLILLGMLFPDIYLGIFRHLISASIPLSNFITTLGISFLLSFLNNRFTIYIFIIMFALTQWIQLNHWAYFGVPIHSHDITKVFLELDEIFITGKTLISKLFEVWIAWGVSILIISYALLKNSKRKKSHYSNTALILLLMFTPFLSYLKGPGFFYTKPTASTTYNTLRAFSDWIALQKNSFKKPLYKPYQITYRKPKAKNIILIMGESQSSRYMHIFGYNGANNTPFLDSLKTTPNFAYAKGISSSVYTRTSLSLFFNMIYGPADTDLIRNKTANLFRLAKKQGYHVVILSAQNEKLFHDTGTEYVDVFLSAKDIKNLKTKGDIALLNFFDTVNLKEQNFIVIHLRHVHSPFGDYSTFLPKEYISLLNNKADQTQQDYISAIAYNDYWVKCAIKRILDKLSKDTVIIFTSDHGELVGERGLYGHNLMEPEVFDVPVWVYDTNKTMADWLRAKKICGHYTLSKQIAEIMGATILNPNEIPNTQFVHGSEFYTNYSYIPWLTKNGKIDFQAKQFVSP